MKIAMIFPGYGSQFVGMAKELYDEHRIVQEYFEEASNCLDINFVKLCFASSDSELAKMNHAYTSLFLVSSAIVGLLQQQGITPSVVAGFNQGAYAALYAARGISFPDGLYLLNKYASFYEAFLSENSMHAIHISGASSSQLESWCKKTKKQAYIALSETENAHIVVGTPDGVDMVRDLATRDIEKNPVSIDAVSADVELHSPFMDPVVEQFRPYLEKVDFKDLLVPMIESLHGKKIEQGEQIRRQVIKRISSPVRWPKVMAELASYDIIVEVGPGTFLGTLAKEQYPDKPIFSINKQLDIDELKKIIDSNTHRGGEVSTESPRDTQE